MNGSLKRKLRAKRARMIEAERSLTVRAERLAWRGYDGKASPVSDRMTVDVGDVSAEDMRKAREAMLYKASNPDKVIKGAPSWHRLMNQRYRADMARDYAARNGGWRISDKDYARPSVRVAVRGTGSGSPVDPAKPLYSALSPEVFLARNGHARPEKSIK